MHSGFPLIMAVNRKGKTKWCTSIKVALSIDPLFSEMAAHNGASQLENMVGNGITGSHCDRSYQTKFNHSASSTNSRLKRAIYSPAETRPGTGVKPQILLMGFF